MITLLTGVPGSGKTSKMVFELLKESGRPIFVMGIPDLLIPHQAVPPISDWTVLEPSPEDPTIKRPAFTFPQNSIIVIDEAQNVYRPRAAASKVPDIVAAFETHRHKGIDFYLLTQHPSLLDSNIKRLVSKHWHVHVTPFGRRLLEWSQARDPDSKGDRNDAISVPYKPPASVFKLYKSSELHTKLKRRIPNSFLIFAFGSIFAIGLIYYGYQRISAKMNPKKTTPELVTASSVQSGAASLPAYSGPAFFVGNPEAYVPAIPDKPETAPMFDQLRVVKTMPQIAGCIETSSSCDCFTQQQTRADISAAACKSWVHNRPFNPYLENVEAARRETGAVAPVSSSIPAPLPLEEKSPASG